MQNGSGRSLTWKRPRWRTSKSSTVGVMLLGLALTPAAHAQVEMTVATYHPRTATADVEGMVHYKKLVEERSNGAIKVNVFFGGTLGGERELIEQIKLGTVHLCIGGWAAVGLYTKAITPWGVPYLFSSQEQIAAAVKGPFGEAIRKAYARNGIYWAGLYFRGNRQLTTNRNVRNPADLKGMRIRLPENPDWLQVWKAFDTLPVPIPSPEIFGSLQTGVVDAQENPISSNYNQKLWEVQKFMVMTNHIVDMNQYLMSASFLDRQTAANRAIMIKAAEDALAWSTKYAADQEAKLLQEMEAKGMIILRPDLKPFQETALKTIDYFKTRWEPWVFDETMKVIKN
ncbi:MAG: TRAP transporter substrate-binding protein [Pseudorhodoplanes sp.]|nr:TRAP transporter substrate-binding protein [Pseudorhodoplanes sp.]